MIFTLILVLMGTKMKIRKSGKGAIFCAEATFVRSAISTRSSKNWSASPFFGTVKTYFHYYFLTLQQIGLIVFYAHFYFFKMRQEFWNLDASSPHLLELYYVRETSAEWISRVIIGAIGGIEMQPYVKRSYSRCCCPGSFKYLPHI